MDKNFSIESLFVFRANPTELTVVQGKLFNKHSRGFWIEVKWFQAGKKISYETYNTCFANSSETLPVYMECFRKFHNPSPIFFRGAKLHLSQIWFSHIDSCARQQNINTSSAEGRYISEACYQSLIMSNEMDQGSMSNIQKIYVICMSRRCRSRRWVDVGFACWQPIEHKSASECDSSPSWRYDQNKSFRVVL